MSRVHVVSRILNLLGLRRSSDPLEELFLPLSHLSPWEAVF